MEGEGEGIASPMEGEGEGIASPMEGEESNSKEGGTRRVRFFDMFRKPKSTRRRKSKRITRRRGKKCKRRTRR
jgi:hypothetical protein